MTVYAGSFINPKSFGQVEFVSYGTCTVDKDGVITEMNSYDGKDIMELALASMNKSLIVRLAPSQFVIPGFVDMHTHAPQYRNLGLGLDYTLLEWLDKVTFPEERSYSCGPSESSETYYERVANLYKGMVKHYLRCGTTSCCYFGSLQMEANMILVDMIAECGQRALVGKTCMDCNSPPDYVEGTVESIEGTRKFAEYVKGVDSKLPVSGTILPVVTPRFALTCTLKSMRGLADIAHYQDLHIQTHLNENLDEIAFASKLYPESESYTEIYERAGLLGSKTFVAHCVHMTDQQRRLLAKHKVAVSHCPASNFALNSGIMDLRAMISAGIRVGLGTDVSGGYGISILDAMRQAIIASKALHFQDKSTEPLKVSEAFYLGTRGGAEALGLPIGAFEKGLRFDALFIDMEMCPVPRHPDETLEQSLQRLVFLGDDRWIVKVLVNGREC
jgi:guanine deaminase